MGQYRGRDGGYLREEFRHAILSFVGVKSQLGQPQSANLHQRVERLFRGHIDAVFNVAYRVLWNRADAEDAVQAAFVKAFTRIDQLADAERERPWLLQIAYREAIAIVRRRRALPVDPSELPEMVDQRSPEDSAVSGEVVRMINAALLELQEQERMAVVLRDIEELSMAQVAEVLDIGLSAAKMRVHRGRQSLRLILEKAEVR